MNLKGKANRACLIATLADYANLVYPGFLLEAGSRVPAPVYLEQSARLLKVRN